MALIGQIRDKGATVAVGLIGLSIVMFLLMDAFGSGSPFRSNNNVLGKVGDVELSPQIYQQKTQDALDNYQRNGMEISDEMRNQASEQAWNQYVEEIIQRKLYDASGIAVTEDELAQLLYSGGENLHSSIKSAQGFQENGQFSKAKLEQYVKDLKKPENADKLQQWSKFEQGVIAETERTKYTNLVKKGIYIPKWYAQKLDADQKRSADINYVLVPYTTVNDNEIKVTDSDLKAYISKHAGQFKQEESRSVKFVSFPVNASMSDSTAAQKAIAERLDGFKNAALTNVGNYLRLSESDTPFDSTYQLKDALPPMVKDTLFKLPIGSTVGPFLENGTYKVARILDRRGVADSLQVREIILPIGKSTSEANKKTTDSIIAAIRSGVNFDTLAKKYSADPKAKLQGGNKRWVKSSDQELPEQVRYDLFYRYKNGDIFKTDLGGGHYIMQITNAGGSKEGVKVGFLSKIVSPSDETVNAIYNNAQTFVSANRDLKSLEANAAKQGLQVREGKDLNKNAYRVEQLSGAGSIVSWAFNQAKVGETAPTTFQVDESLPDGRKRSSYVVAALSSSKKEGLADVEDARQKVEAEVIKEKKAEKILAKVGNAKDMSKIAAASGQQMYSVKGVTFAAPQIESIGREPKVQAAASVLKQGEVSKPIIGNTGVFFIQPIAVTEATPPTDLSAIKTQTAQPMQQMADYGLFQAIKKMMNVEDNRYKMR